ncbi:fat cadherin-related tumor suppressor-like, partial [Tropilaelaps mercedesae]
MKEILSALFQHQRNFDRTTAWAGSIHTRSVLDCENKPYYWLVVSAQDRAAVPLSSRLDIFIKVNDVNDNIPLTKLPYYKSTVLEDSPANVSVLAIEAFDGDHTSNAERLRFKISAGDPQGHFQIDEQSGLITTTERRLDRESQDKYLLDVTVMDDGVPALSSVTQVLVHVGDVNDHDPRYTQVQYRFKILEQDELTEQADLAQVVASDADAGANSELAYSIVKGASFRFAIDQQSGMIRSRSALVADELHELHVKVSDLGEAPRHSTCVVMLQVAARPTTAGNRPPKVKAVDVSEVLETDKVGHVVAMISAIDLDLHTVYFRIGSGNEKKLFALKKPDEGAVIIARPIVQSDVGTYTLGIEATDGLSKTFVEFNVTVMDDNNQYPEFIEERYSVEVSEMVKPGTDILKIKAVDKDVNDQLFYAIHNAAAVNSMKRFHLAASTGVLQVVQSLDHEEAREHVITALAKDSGLPGKRAYVRIHVHVADHNDHAPEFLQSSFEGKVFESAAVGTSVVQCTAVDTDRGENARISYSIVSGECLL